MSFVDDAMKQRVNYMKFYSSVNVQKQTTRYKWN